jgi:hypothetical protein
MARGLGRRRLMSDRITGLRTGKVAAPWAMLQPVSLALRSID